ncbi:carbohydrate-binding domain-containing protein [Desulfotomaculum defluvii]
MSYRSHKLITLLTAGMLFASVLSGCQEGSSANLPLSTASAAELSPIDPGYSERDLSGTWDEQSATKISLNGSSITASGPGATASGGTLTITAAGIYVLSGTLANGQIVVNAAESDKVQLVLDGVSITSSNSAAIYVKQADKVFLTLADGKKNTVTDGATYNLANGVDEPNAAIFSKSDLTINGKGELTVTANYKNGITSKDDLVIAGGTITVTAVNDGLRGRDAVAIHDGALVINASQGDGIQSNNTEDAQKGWVSIDGGTLNITAGQDGIQAETVVQITNGTVNTKTGGGSANANTDSKVNEQPSWGDGGKPTTIKTTEDSVDNENDSAKGFKAGTAIYVTGGKINIDSSDDAVHSNGNVVIKTGTLTLISGDDGIHADTSLVVDGGTIDISQSYEGMEGTNITVNGGNIHVTAKDDGINAAGDNDRFALGRPRENNFTATSSGDNDSAYIRITNGNVVVNAAGDGLDTNGSLYVDGGTVLVNGPTGQGNGALDYDSVAEITGGTLVAAGSSGMAQNFSDNSKQNSLLVAYSSIQKAGTLVSLQDENGKTILSFAPANEYQSIVISSPKLEQGKTYTLYSGGSSGGKNIDGLYTDGSLSAGSKVVSVTLSGVSTNITDTGAQFTGMGGPGRGGHMGGPKGPRPDRNQGNVGQ